MGCNHARVLRELGGVGDLIICDTNSKLVNGISQKYRIASCYKSVFEMMRKEKLDGVVLSTPTDTHYEIAKSILEYEVPLLIEKPISQNCNQAEELVSRFRDKKIPLMIGYVERFNPVIHQLKQVIVDIGIDKVLHINLLRIGPFPVRSSLHTDGVVLDLSTHDLDIIHFLFGLKIARVFMTTRMGEKADIYARALLEIGNDITASCEWSWISPQRKRFVEVFTSKGCLVADLSRQDLFFYNHAPTDLDGDQDHFKLLQFGKFQNEFTKFSVTKKEPLKEELIYFLKMIDNEAGDNSNQPVALMRILEKLYESSHSRGYVDTNECYAEY